MRGKVQFLPKKKHSLDVNALTYWIFNVFTKIFTGNIIYLVPIRSFPEHNYAPRVRDDLRRAGGTARFNGRVGEPVLIPMPDGVRDPITRQ